MLPLIAYVAHFAGMMAGSLRDPLTIMFVVICLVLGINRAAWYWPAIATAILTAMTVPVVYSWWKEIGVDPVTETILMFVVKLATLYVAFLFGGSVGRAVSGTKSAEPPSA